MRATRSLRFGAFIAAVGGAAALVGLAATGTGAYFTDVQSGHITGTFGQVKVAVNGVTVPAGDTKSGLNLHWNNMLPGSDKTVTWKVTNTGTTPESIWLAFDNTNGEWANINSLGSYGDAKINSPLLNADYNNLNNLYPEGTPPNAGQVNACGEQEPAIAYLPAENNVAELGVGGSTSFTFSFGYGDCLSDNSLQGKSAFAKPLVYDIIATQQGVTPSDARNGSAYTLPPAPSSLPAGESWNT